VTIRVIRVSNPNPPSVAAATFGRGKQYYFFGFLGGNSGAAAWIVPPSPRRYGAPRIG